MRSNWLAGPQAEVRQRSLQQGAETIRSTSPAQMRIRPMRRSAGVGSSTGLQSIGMWRNIIRPFPKNNKLRIT